MNADLKIDLQDAVTAHTRANVCLSQLSVTISTCVVAHKENAVSYFVLAAKWCIIKLFSIPVTKNEQCYMI